MDHTACCCTIALLLVLVIVLAWRCACAGKEKGAKESLADPPLTAVIGLAALVQFAAVPGVAGKPPFSALVARARADPVLAPFLTPKGTAAVNGVTTPAAAAGVVTMFGSTPRRVMLSLLELVNAGASPAGAAANRALVAASNKAAAAYAAKMAACTAMDCTGSGAATAACAKLACTAPAKPFPFPAHGAGRLIGALAGAAGKKAAAAAAASFSEFATPSQIYYAFFMRTSGLPLM